MYLLLSFNVDIIFPSLEMIIFEAKPSSIRIINLLGADNKYSLFSIKYLFESYFII